MTDIQDFRQFMILRKAASDSFAGGDPAPLQAISATKDPATIFGPNGDCVQGATKVTSANNKSAEHFAPGGKNEFEIMHMAASGDFAYWVGIQRSVVNVRGHEPAAPMDLRITEIFRREQGEWKLVHRHADKLAAA
ncbi:MAG TPA: nuclear transport factor 2 family protein [Rhodocyclaceae bacterium]|nr:nuclear transport factor 2 family protein [Rhodocyclaceae bacterium]